MAYWVAVVGLEVEEIALTEDLPGFADGVDLPVAVGPRVAPGGLEGANRAVFEADHGLGGVFGIEVGLVVVVAEADDFFGFGVGDGDEHIGGVVARVQCAAAPTGFRGAPPAPFA